MAHGFSGTKDGLRHQASRFASAGFAVLAFDYRYFGESEGMPRQLIATRQQVQDYHAAVRFVASIPEVDAQLIALWGTSLSGGHVLTVAAGNPAVAAVISQVPWVGIDFRAKDPRGTGVTLRLFGAAILDLLASAIGAPPLLLPVIGLPGELAAFNDPEATRAVEAMSTGGAWVNAFTARTLFDLMRYRPARYTSDVAAPLLVCVADQDAYAPPRLTIETARSAPRGELRRYPIRHFDAYLEAADSILDDQIAFLNAHLRPSVGAAT